MSDRKKVILRAPVLSRSGYGTHARQIAKYLFDKHKQNEIELYVRVVPWGITPWLINKNAQNGFIGDLMGRTMEYDGPFDVSVQLQLPNEWDPKLAKINIGVTAGVETDRCNPEWIKALDAMDGVIVPTEFIRQCFLNSGSETTDITVIPESYNPSIAACDEPLPIEISTDFNFLIFGQLTGNNKDNDRKNIFHTVRWLCEEFADDKDIGIILKTNMGRSTKIDRQVVLNTFTQIIKEIRKTEFPKIHMLHGDMSDDELAKLYRHKSLKAFVLLSRGEGFCLPMLDAAASGLPVIATNHSGYLDFMNKGRFIKIDYALNKLHKTRVDKNIFMPEAKWAEANEQDFKKKIRKFRNSNKIPTEWAAKLKKDIVMSHSHDSISKIYDSFFMELFKC